MKTEIRLATTNGYIFRNGKLMAYEFISALVDFSKGEVNYTCMLGGKEETFTTDMCPAVYEGEKSYQAKDGNEGELWKWSDVLRRCWSANTYGSKCDESGIFQLWSVGDNEPVPEYAPMANFLFKKEGNRTKVKYVGEGTYYDTEEHASLYCDLIKVDENGIEYVTKSVAHRMLLNEEQLKAIEGIKDAIENAKGLGVEILYDREGCDIMAFSKLCMVGYHIDGRGYMERKGYVDCTDLMKETGISIIDTSTCDCGLYVDWK